MSFYKLRISVLFLSLALSLTAFAKDSQVFVSFSMPEQLLVETLRDCARLSIPATLNGLHHNSMMETVAQITHLTKEVPNVSIQIDPTAFERFGITQVPALVVDDGQCFDVIYGNLPIEEGLSRIDRQGQCARGKAI